MEKIELQEIIEACDEADSEYIKLYRPLLGYEDEISLNRGIDDSLEFTLNEIEKKEVKKDEKKNMYEYKPFRQPPLRIKPPRKVRTRWGYIYY